MAGPPRLGLLILAVLAVAPRALAIGQAAPPPLPDMVPGRSGVWHKAPALGSLQQAIDKVQPGQTLHLGTGLLQGPILIRTPNVTIIGGGSTVISGDGKGSVIIIEANGVTLSHLTVSGSGSSYDQVDAGIALRQVEDAHLHDVTVLDCLFGIDIATSKRVTVDNAVISSKHLALALRGDALRIFASEDVEVRHSYWHDTRDAATWYSTRIKFIDNKATRARYSIHSMYTRNLLIQGNQFDGNTVGIFIMYGEATTVLDNVVRHSNGFTGLGLGMKETSALFAKGNSFIYCGSGVLVDNSPFLDSTRDWFQDNVIAYNGVGVLFSDGKSGNLFEHNTFVSNGVDADSDSRTPSQSFWHGNYWDDYDGFDRNQDGVGDTPFKVLKYPDLMALSHPMAQFFYGSPVTLLIALVERLLPITDPLVVLVDDAPHMQPWRGARD